MTAPRLHRLPARGLTLVEVMVAGTIMSVVLAGAMSALMGFNSGSERLRRIGDAQGSARQALDALEMELRAAGIGASRGHVGLAPAAGPIRRVPTIYSEPDQVITTPGGATVTSSSIFIISAEPASVGISATGDGMQGVVAQLDRSDAGAQPISIACSSGAGDGGSFVPCNSGNYGGSALIPSDGTSGQLLISDDFHWSVMITPTTVTVPDPNHSNNTALSFIEQASAAFVPDAKQPYGFGQGAHVLRARVTHWYIKAMGDGTTQLVRSRPVLRSTAFTTTTGPNCDPTESPFLDETNGGPDGGTSAAVTVGSAPIEGLLVRYVLGASVGIDDPKSWTVSAAPLTSCDMVPAENLREVRVGVVARTLTPDVTAQKAGNAGALYTPPSIDNVSLITNLPAAAVADLAGGLLPTATDLKAIADPYPRRSFQTRVAPRNALGYLP